MIKQDELMGDVLSKKKKGIKLSIMIMPEEMSGGLPEKEDMMGEDEYSEEEETDDAIMSMPARGINKKVQEKLMASKSKM